MLGNHLEGHSRIFFTGHLHEEVVRVELEKGGDEFFVGNIQTMGGVMVCTWAGVESNRLELIFSAVC